MKYETPLHKAQGLGSSKSGVRHWLAQRITAIGLIPLGLWFMASLIILVTAPFDVAQQWLHSPWVAGLALLFMAISFYHGALGLQVVLEDYISRELMRGTLILTTKFLSLLMTLLVGLSILKTFLT